MADVKMIILKPSAMPEFGTVESAFFKPWALVASDPSIPIVVTNHKETHDNLAVLGQQSLLAQFYTVPGIVNAEINNKEDIDKLLDGLTSSLKKMSDDYDFKPDWHGRQLVVVVGGKTTKGPDFDAEAIEAGEVPVSVLANFCRSLVTSKEVKVVFKGTLDPRAIDLVLQTQVHIKNKPDFKEQIATQNEQLKADLIHADILEAKRQGGMPEATAALDKIMRGAK